MLGVVALQMAPDAIRSGNPLAAGAGAALGALAMLIASLVFGV